MLGYIMLRYPLRSATPMLAFAALLASLASSTAPSSAEDAGPSALSETYGDWVVKCASVQAEGKTDSKPRSVCQMSQELRQSQSGKRALLIVFGINAKDSGLLSGTIIAPFGLDLKSGLSLKMADTVYLEAPFKTCVPQGCVAAAVANSELQAAMRAGAKLTIAMTAADSGQPVNMDVSLKGFGQASDRLAALLKKNE
jgi:invasion protein IalB